MRAGRSWRVSGRAGPKRYFQLGNEPSKEKKMLWGCDSGEKALDEVTGNRAVKHYHKSKEDLEKLTDQQSERLKSIPDEEKEEGK